MYQFIASFFTVLSLEFSCYPREAHSAPIKGYKEAQNIVLNPPTSEANLATEDSQATFRSLVDCAVIPHRPALAKIVVEGSIAFSFALLIGMIVWCVLNSKKNMLKALGPHMKKYAKKNFFLRQIQKEKEAARKKLKQDQLKATEVDKDWEGSEEAEDGQEEENKYSAMKGKGKKEKKGRKHAIKKKLGKFKKIAEHKAIQKGVGKIKKAAKSKVVQKHVGKMKKVAKSKAVQKQVGKIKKAANSKAIQKQVGKIKKAAKSKAIQKQVGKIKKAAKSKTVQKHVGKIKKVANKKAIKKNLGKIKEAHDKIHKKVNKLVKEKREGKSSKKKKKGNTKDKKSSHRKAQNEEDESD